MNAINPQQLVQQGMALHKAGRLAEAEPLYEAALKLLPGAYPALHLMGLLKQQQGKHDDALALMERALEAQPGAPETLVNYGLALLTTERHEDALTALEQAVAALPGNSGAWNNRGLALAKLGRLVEAAESYRKAIALTPGFAEAHFNEGLVFLQMRCPNEALNCFGRATALKPDYAQAHFLRGQLFRETDNSTKALESFEKALAADPGLVAALAARGQLLCEMDRIEAGMADLASSAKMTAAADTDEPVLKERHDREQREYLAGGGAPADGSRLDTRAVNIVLQNEIAELWRTGNPRIVVIDSLFSGEAMAALRRYCLAAPMWRTVREDGALTALLEDGLASPLLAQIIGELRATFSPLFQDHPFRDAWATQETGPSSIQTGEAAVTVQIWITPDEANSDPQSGGMIVWGTPAPPDFNPMTMDPSEFLASSTTATIAYRFNRAVIFDSTLCHATDKIGFRDGYRDRRIALTLLFGRRPADLA